MEGSLINERNVRKIESYSLTGNCLIKRGDCSSSQAFGKEKSRGT